MSQDPENASTGTDDYQVNNESQVPVLCFAKTYWLKLSRNLLFHSKSCMNAFKMLKGVKCFDGEGTIYLKVRVQRSNRFKGRAGEMGLQLLHEKCNVPKSCFFWYTMCVFLLIFYVAEPSPPSPSLLLSLVVCKTHVGSHLRSGVDGAPA